MSPQLKYKKAFKKSNGRVLLLKARSMNRNYYRKNGQASYTILTLLEKKDRLPIERFFSKHQTFDSPFIIMGREVNSEMVMEIEYFE